MHGLQCAPSAAVVTGASAGEALTGAAPISASELAAMMRLVAGSSAHKIQLSFAQRGGALYRVIQSRSGLSRQCIFDDVNQHIPPGLCRVSSRQRQKAPQLVRSCPKSSADISRFHIQHVLGT